MALDMDWPMDWENDDTTAAPTVHASARPTCGCPACGDIDCDNPDCGMVHCPSCDAVLAFVKLGDARPDHCVGCDGPRISDDFDLAMHEALWPAGYGDHDAPGADPAQALGIVNAFRQSAGLPGVSLPF